MEIKHTHPVYANEAERLEKLKDTRRTCAALLNTIKKSTPAKSA